MNGQYVQRLVPIRNTMQNRFRLRERCEDLVTSDGLGDSEVIRPCIATNKRGHAKLYTTAYRTNMRDLSQILCADRAGSEVPWTPDEVDVVRVEFEACDTGSDPIAVEFMRINFGRCCLGPRARTMSIPSSRELGRWIGLIAMAGQREFRAFIHDGMLFPHLGCFDSDEGEDLARACSECGNVTPGLAERIRRCVPGWQIYDPADPWFPAYRRDLASPRGTYVCFGPHFVFSEPPSAIFQPSFLTALLSSHYHLPFAIGRDVQDREESWIRFWTVLTGIRTLQSDWAVKYRRRSGVEGSRALKLKAVELAVYDGDGLPEEHAAAFRSAVSVFITKHIEQLEATGLDLYSRANGDVRRIDSSWLSPDHYKIEIVDDRSFIVATTRSPTEREGERIAVHFDPSPHPVETTNGSGLPLQIGELERQIDVSADRRWRGCLVQHAYAPGSAPALRRLWTRRAIRGCLADDVSAEWVSRSARDVLGD